MNKSLWIPEDVKSEVEAGKKIISSQSFWGNQASGYVDSFNHQRSPDKRKLLNENEDVVYSCATINSQTVAATPARLYVTVGQGQKTRWKTKKSINTSYLSTKSINAYDAEEVVDPTHPWNRLKSNPNNCHSWKDVLTLTQGSLEIIGTSYAKISFNRLGVPQEWWPLQAERMKPVLDSDQQLIHWEYTKGHGQVEKLYPNHPEYIIITFTMNNLGDFYGEGRSPLRAIWEPLQIANKIMAHESTLLDNQARPDFLISFGADGGPAEEEWDRMEWRLKQKFRRGDGGFAFTENASITPLSFPPKDMFFIEFFGLTKTQIANAYGIPMAMLETESVNRANLDASRDMHAKQSIQPRLCNLEDVINQKIISLFDPSGRTFVAFDDPCPENVELRLQQEKAKAEIDAIYVGKIKTANEIRETLGLESRDDGDALAGTGPQPTPVTIVEDQPKDVAEAPAPVVEETPQEIQTLPASTLNGAQIASALQIIQQVAAGQLPRDSGVASLEILVNLSNEQAERMMGTVGAGFALPTVEAPTKLFVPDSMETKAGPKRKPLEPNKQLVKILQKHFKKWEGSIISSVAKGKKGLPKEFVPLESWSNDLANEVKPVIEIIFEDEGKSLLQRVGASPDVFSVFNKKVKTFAEKNSIKLADSTLATTTKSVNAALEATRDTIADGLEDGESIAKLTAKIGEIFESASESRSMNIAKTETQRCYLEGQRTAAKDSGVVKGFKHLASSNPCQICADLDGKVYDLDDPLPPDNTHPSCECGMIEILDFEED